MDFFNSLIEDMSRLRRLIIPVFLPFAGCPHQCVFCNQEGITGGDGLPAIEEVHRIILEHLSTWRRNGPVEAAFYGGSFTALPLETQRVYLDAAGEYLRDGLIESIRVSTRPDSVTESGLAFLKGHGVRTVELGVQSMSEEVLRLSGRGHTPSDTVRAVSLLKVSGMKTGAQFMPGLPGDTPERSIETAKEIIRLSPDFARVYPTVVLRGTPLEKMYLDGRYSPWSLDKMVDVCRVILRLFKEAGIPVARMGLQTTESLRDNIVAGPYHPSLRQLVESSA